MIIYGPEDLKTEFELSPGIAAKLQIYADLLTKWQARINLVGKNTLPELWHRHFRDSAQLAAYMNNVMDTRDVWLDVGSGAGEHAESRRQGADGRDGPLRVAVEEDGRSARPAGGGES